MLEILEYTKTFFRLGFCLLEIKLLPPRTAYLCHLATFPRVPAAARTSEVIHFYRKLGHVAIWRRVGSIS